MAKSVEIRAEIKKLKDEVFQVKKKGMDSSDVEFVRKSSVLLSAYNDKIEGLQDELVEAEVEEKRAYDSLNPNFDSQRFPEDEKRGFKDPLAAASLGAGSGNPAQPQGQIRSLGAFAYGQGTQQTHNNGGNHMVELTKEYLEKCEQRGAYLKERKVVTFTAEDFPELRAVSIGSSNLVTSAKYSNILIPKFNEVSSIVDVVNAIPLNGGNSYTQGFEVSSGMADYTTETGVYTDADPVFDNVAIGKAKITAYSELTDEAKQLPNVDYQARVAANMIISIRKKIAAQIILGAGGNNQLMGIYNAPANVMPLADVDLGISAIDETTLDTLIFGYGGDENVEGGQYLFLNKKDLAEFAAVRATTGQKLYNITLNGNVGTISSDRSYSVNFIINSNCPALSDANTAAGTYTMIYGSPAAYEMPVFSQIEVLESLDFKFQTGLMSFRSSVWCGGNVVKFRGFTRVKKVAAI